MIMTRRLTFSAALADWNPTLSRNENEAIFGTSASPEPYGHNYLLDVSVKGSIDPRNGILVNIKEIDRIVKEKVIQTLDRKFINRQVPAFHARPVTAETLIEFIADTLANGLPPAVELSALRLADTPTHSVNWNASEVGRMSSRKVTGTMLLTRVYEFSASHRLDSAYLSPSENQELFGKCNYENGHGHNYELEVTVAGPVSQQSGRVIAEEALDTIVNSEVVNRYDHHHLNLDIPEFRDQIPSAEIITKVIWERLVGHIPTPVRLHKVLLRETARNIFEYYGEDEDVQ